MVLAACDHFKLILTPKIPSCFWRKSVVSDIVGRNYFYIF